MRNELLKMKENKVLFEVKIDECFKKSNDEKFLFVRQIECHMGIRTYNRLYVLNIYQYLFVHNQTPPNPLHI